MLKLTRLSLLSLGRVHDLGQLKSLFERYWRDWQWWSVTSSTSLKMLFTKIFMLKFQFQIFDFPLPRVARELATISYFVHTREIINKFSESSWRGRESENNIENILFSFLPILLYFIKFMSCLLRLRTLFMKFIAF